MIVSSRSHTKTLSKSDSGPGDGSGLRPCFFALLDSERKQKNGQNLLHSKFKICQIRKHNIFVWVLIMVKPK